MATAKKPAARQAVALKTAEAEVNAASPTPTPTPTVPLPTWTDAASIASYITSVLGAAFAVITALHPGFSEPTIVQAIVPAVSAIIAGAAQVFNIVTHRSVQKAALASGASVSVRK